MYSGEKNQNVEGNSKQIINNCHIPKMPNST